MANQDSNQQPTSEPSASAEYSQQDDVPTPFVQTTVDVGSTREPKDLVWAFFLIVVGIMLLLNSLDLVSWSIWSVLWRFWPIFLVFGGLQIIFGRSRISTWIIGLVALMTFLLLSLTAVGMVQSELLTRWNISLPGWWTATVSSEGDQINDTVTVSANTSDSIRSISLDLDIGIGEMTVTDDTSAADLVAIDAQYYESFGEPLLTSEIADAEQKVVFTQGASGNNWRFANGTPSYDVVFGNATVPASIDLSVGAGSGTFALDEMSVSSFNADVGAGSLSVSLSKKAVPSNMNLHVGAGKMVLTLPKETEFHISHDVGVGVLVVDGKTVSSFNDESNQYQTDHFDTVEHPVSITADVGVGRLEVVRK